MSELLNPNIRPYPRTAAAAPAAGPSPPARGCCCSWGPAQASACSPGRWRWAAARCSQTRRLCSGTHRGYTAKGTVFFLPCFRFSLERLFIVGEDPLSPHSDGETLLKTTFLTEPSGHQVHRALVGEGAAEDLQRHGHYTLSSLRDHCQHTFCLAAFRRKNALQLSQEMAPKLNPREKSPQI